MVNPEWAGQDSLRISGTNVLRTAQHTPPQPLVSENPSRLDNRVLDTFLAYWNGRRGVRLMPARGDIGATDLKAWLGWLCLVEALPGYNDFRFRLIGSRVADYILADATGLTVREAYAAAQASREETEAVLGILRRTCEARHPMRVTGAGGEWCGHLYPDYDVLYLPLSDDGATANMVMIGFSFNHRTFLSARVPGAATSQR